MAKNRQNRHKHTQQRAALIANRAADKANKARLEALVNTFTRSPEDGHQKSAFRQAYEAGILIIDPIN